MQQQVFAALNNPLQSPRRPIRCSSLTKDIRQYTINYDVLTRKCSAMMVPEPVVVQNLKTHLTTVQQTFNTDNALRLNQYKIKIANDKSLSAQDKATKTTDAQTAFDKARQDYTDTVNKFRGYITANEGRIDASTTGQACQTAIQQAIIGQAAEANNLLGKSEVICNELNDAYSQFQRALDGAYTNIGAPIPPA